MADGDRARLQRRERGRYAADAFDAPVPVPGRIGGTDRLPAAHPDAAVERSLLRAADAVRRIEETTPALAAALGRRDYGESGMLAFEIRMATNEGRRSLAAFEAGGAHERAAATRQRLASAEIEAAHLVAAAPRLDRPGAGSEEAERAWRAGPLAIEPAGASDRAPPGTTYAPTGSDVAAPTPAPAGHQSRKLVVDFPAGPVTGSIVATLELGPTGVPVVADHIKLLESTITTEVNTFATRLSAALLTGELDLEVFEGFQLALEVNALEGSLAGKDGIDLSLVTIEVKVRGDGTRWLPPDRGMSLTIDGVIGVELGGKLAAKLAEDIAGRAAQAKLVADLELRGVELERLGTDQTADAARRESLLARRGTPDVDKELAELDRRLASRKGTIGARAKEVGRVASELDGIGKRLARSGGKVRNWVATKVARVLGSTIGRRIARVLAKLIPVLNVVSTILDVIDIIRLVVAIAKGAGGGDGDSDEEGDGGGAESSSSETDDGTVLGGDEPDAAAKAAREALHPMAKSIIMAALGANGAVLSPAQIETVGMMVPHDLTPEELHAVIAAVRRGGASNDPEEVVAAIDAAVRARREPAQQVSVSVDGVARPDLGPGAVSSPAQIDGPSDKTLSVLPEVRVVKYFPPDVAAAWFEVQGDQIVATAAQAEWIAEHTGKEIGDLGVLLRVEPRISGSSLDLRFSLRGEREVTFRHQYLVGDRDGGAVLMPIVWANVHD
jgi:hypothetical protein